MSTSAVPIAKRSAGTQQVRHCPREGVSRNTRPLKIPAGAPYAHMITCPSSLEVGRLDRRADSTTAPRYLPSQKLGPKLGVKGRRVRTSQGAHQRPLRRNGCRGRLPPTDHPVTSFNRLLAPCPRRAQTAGDSRPIADSSGWPRPAQSRGPPRWIARIKLVPKLTVRVRFPSPAPCSNTVAAQANPTVSLKQVNAHSRPKTALVQLRVPLAILASAPGDCQFLS